MKVLTTFKLSYSPFENFYRDHIILFPFIVTYLSWQMVKMGLVICLEHPSLNGWYAHVCSYQHSFLSPFALLVLDTQIISRKSFSMTIHAYKMLQAKSITSVFCIGATAALAKTHQICHNPCESGYALLVLFFVNLTNWFMHLSKWKGQKQLNIII